MEAFITTENLQTRLPEIAAQLGPEWQHERPNDSSEQPRWGYLVHPDGRKLAVHLRTKSRKLRLDISGHYPLTADKRCAASSLLRYQETKPTIELDPNKGAKRIAADISRRFLPLYEPLLARATELVAAEAAAESARAAAFETLCKAAGSLLVHKFYQGTSRDLQKPNAFRIESPEPGLWGGAVSIASPDGASFSLTLPLELGAAFLRALAHDVRLLTQAPDIFTVMRELAAELGSVLDSIELWSTTQLLLVQQADRLTAQIVGEPYVPFELPESYIDTNVEVSP